MISRTLVLLLATALTLATQRLETKGTIQGIVVAAASSIPVEGARLNLLRANLPTGAPAATSASDADGKFSFANLDPGSYTISISSSGYVRQNFGSHGTGLPALSLTVSAGQSKNDIVIRMTPTGNISGRILNSDRQPVGEISVQLLQRTYLSNGMSRMQVVQSVRTDDRGTYRMYWVTPGSYFLSAGGPTSNLQRYWAESFFPGGNDVDAATKIEIASGGEATAGLMLPHWDALHIHGRVLDTRTGRPPDDAHMVLINERAGTAIGLGGTYNPVDGSFDWPNVAPGTYIVQAQAEQGAIRGSAPVTVINKDVGNVLIDLIAPVSVAGKLQSNGPPLGSIPRLANIRLGIDAIYRADFGGSAIGIGVDGLFTIEGVTPNATVRINGYGVNGDFYLKEVRFNSADVLYQTFQVPASGPRNLDIVISNSGGRIEGSVTDISSNLAAQVPVVLVPDLHRDVTWLYKRANSDDKGHFAFTNVPPGSYKLFALDSMEPYAYFDPDFVKQFDDKGTAVRIGESSKNTVDLKLIP
jgi:hypothetical protein